MITHYKNWLSKQGTTQKVQRLEFLGFAKDETGIKPVTFKSKEGNLYLCALYRCRNKEGEIENLKFRVEYEPSSTENDVGWGYTKPIDALKDTVPDSVTCLPEMCKAGFVGADYESPWLIEESRKRYNTILKLESIISNERFDKYHKLAKARLRFIESPTNESMNEFKEMRNSNKDLHQELNNIVDEYIL